MYLLKPGHSVNHEHFGVCTVIGVLGHNFGVKLSPDTEEARIYLSELTGMHPDTPYLETEACQLNFIVLYESKR